MTQPGTGTRPHSSYLEATAPACRDCSSFPIMLHERSPASVSMRAGHDMVTSLTRKLDAALDIAQYVTTRSTSIRATAYAKRWWCQHRATRAKHWPCVLIRSLPQ